MNLRRVMVAGMIGNGLEWYDFALYGYFVPILGALFLPMQDKFAQAIAAYGMFAVGFLMRPLGAVLFGYLGDAFGRKFALTLSILMMALPTACIGLLPTYAQIGLWAPMLLIVIRLLQGLSLAGQFSGSIAFIVEHAPPGKRGFAGSMTILSLCAGMLLGSLVATLFTRLLSPEDLRSWGWRIPFLLGACIAVVGFYIRRHTEESPAYVTAQAAGSLSKTPVRELWRGHKTTMLRGVMMYLSVTVPFYILSIYLSSYLADVLGHPAADALLGTTLSMVLVMLLVPASGWATDRYGRKRVMCWVLIAYIVAAYPLFCLMQAPSFAPMLTAQLLLSVIVAFYIGAAPAVFVELFPTSVRYTGMALSYNLAAAVFGGTAPMVSAWLIRTTHIVTMPAWYMMVCAFCSLIAFIGYRDRYAEPYLE